MKKRMLAALLAVLILCLAAAGCGKDKEKEIVPEEPVEVYAPTPTPARMIYPKAVTEDFAAMAEDDQEFSAFNGHWTITLPDSWDGLWGCKEGDYGVRFVDITNAEAGYGGLVFLMLYFPASQDFSYVPDYVELASDDNGTYIASFPTDVQYNWTDAALTAEFESMSSGLRDWLPEHFVINN